MTGDRVAEIESRLAAVKPPPWSVMDAHIRHTQIDGWVDPVGRKAAQAQTENDIQFVMNAPADLRYLLDELAKAKRAARTLGKIVDDQCRDALAAAGQHHLIGEDGDGDWAAVWENLAELRPERDRLLDENAKLTAALDAVREACARMVLPHQVTGEPTDPSFQPAADMIHAAITSALGGDQ